MKIKEICIKTGLTERAVRYYIERGLISPDTTEQRDRTYYHFTDEHLTQLRNIALLRQCGFSIDAISEMNAAPSHIPALIHALWEETRSQSDELESRLEILGSLSRSPAISLSDLARQLYREYTARSLPDLTQQPDFGRLDELPSEKASPEETQRYLNQKLTFYGHTRTRLLISAAAVLVMALAGLLGYRWHTAEINTFVFLPSVTFSEKYMENGKFYATMTVYPDDFTDTQNCYSLPVRFEDWTLFHSTLSDTPYAAANLNVSLRRREAKKLGLYSPDTQTLDYEKILADEALSRQYAAVNYLQGDLE